MTLEKQDGKHTRSTKTNMMISLVKIITVLYFVMTLSGCNGCYESYEEAWAACDDKYNGKCRYLGKQFKVCEGTSNSRQNNTLVPCGSDADCKAKNPHIHYSGYGY